MHDNGTTAIPQVVDILQAPCPYVLEQVLNERVVFCASLQLAARFTPLARQEAVTGARCNSMHVKLYTEYM